jgi:cell wall-associated NlpC family hydrolase
LRASENDYRSGGTSKAGFDCSGLMCSTFEAFDIKLQGHRENNQVLVQN